MPGRTPLPCTAPLSPSRSDFPPGTRYSLVSREGRTHTAHRSPYVGKSASCRRPASLFGCPMRGKLRTSIAVQLGLRLAALLFTLLLLTPPHRHTNDAHSHTNKRTHTHIRFTVSHISNLPIFICLLRERSAHLSPSIPPPFIQTATLHPLSSTLSSSRTKHDACQTRIFSAAHTTTTSF